MLKMHKIMNHPELVIVMHSSIQRFHGLRSSSAFGNCTIDGEFGSHKVGIFSLDLSNNIWGMDGFAIGVPVDWLEVGSTFGGLAIEV